MARREERRAARRREVLDAAWGLVLEGGLDGLTIAALAERVGAAVGALYRYFPGKEALVAALQTEAIGALHADLTARLRAVEGMAAERGVTRAAGALACAAAPALGYLAEARRAPARHRLIAAILGAPAPVLDEATALEVERSVGALIALAAAPLEAAAQAGALEPGPPRQRTLLAWAAVQGLSSFAHRDRFVAPEERSDALAGPLLVTLLRGWGADPVAARDGVAVTLLALAPAPPPPPGRRRRAGARPTRRGPEA